MPFLGYGIGLRRTHFDTLPAWLERFDFFEVLSENFMAFGGRPREVLRRVAAARPVVLHGVSLSIGSVDPLDESYLDALSGLIDEVKPRWFSDHLCLSSFEEVDYHDLVPLPFTEEAVAHVAERVRAVAGRAPVPFLLENPSYYIAYRDSEMSEAEFLREVVTRADCGLLLDVNNVYVNAENHGYDARAFIDALPLERVAQLHMAGHLVLPDVIIDTHGAPVVPAVMDLFRYVLERTGPVSTLLEWDHDIPPIDVMARELDAIRTAGREVLGDVAPDGVVGGEEATTWRR
ncbi:MAG: DUF692 domain-containing protein [Deltaproteobacteria bacterium]|nr:DUF692 domain-containing protein [Deltaproteobacteria bacterium]